MIEMVLGICCGWIIGVVSYYLVNINKAKKLRNRFPEESETIIDFLKN